tara:strand:+ start:862 stop:1509 length:648 start_codon:yes stop_codon:yes gene_type:complete
MADKYVPNTNTIYDSLDAFLTGENIPQDLHGYFEEYDPAREELLESEQALASRKARFELNNQKRQLLSQTGKMGFAASGEMAQGMENLMSMFEQEQEVQGQADTLAIEDTKRDWLNAQYSIAGSLADEITDGNRNVVDIAKDIHGADGHWEMSILDNYYDNAKERKFLAYMEDVGKSEWDNWKSWNRSSKKELSNRYNKGWVQAKAEKYKDPGKE